MNRYFMVCMASVAGLFAISQSIALISIFDYYFYILPFGIALAGLFLTAGIVRLFFFASINTGMLQALPLFSAFALFMSLVLYLYATSLGPSLFFLLLVIVQLVTYVSIWLVVVRGEQLALSTTGVTIGLALGYAFIAYLNMDPLVVVSIACIFSAALYIVQFLKKMRNVVTILIVCFVAFAAFQAKQYHLMPDSLGWILDYGKARPENLGDRSSSKKFWGSAGLSEMYALGEGERAEWLYTNGSSPGLVLTDTLASYDEAWWVQKAPLAMAIHDAVQPKSFVDIGLVPSDIVWRAFGQGGQKVYGLYGSRDWSRMQVPGLDLIRRSVESLQQPVLSAEDKIKLPVDMIVLSSGHDGKEGWISSNAGEQTFLNQENIQSYWKRLDEGGVLVLLSRHQTVFLGQFFSVWNALSNTGMSDAEFLDRAWGVVPVDTVTIDSPYRYALVLTKRARDAKFAQALRGQVIKLPVRYLFGFNITPSPPYHVLYQQDMNKVHAIFTQAISGMAGKNLTLEASNSHKSIPYQFVEDVFPQYKNMLVLSVGILLGIILFPLQQLRQVEKIQTLRGPSVAVWMVSGGAIGVLLVVALAFLLIYPSNVAHEFRLLYLGILLLSAALMHAYKESVSITRRPELLLVLVSGLVLMFYLATSFMQITENDSRLSVGVAGIFFVSLGITLPFMKLVLVRHSEAKLVGWWWFAMAAGCAAALFWSMRLYSALGDGLLLVSGLLLMCVAGVFWWYSRSPSVEICECRDAGGAPVL